MSTKTRKPRRPAVPSRTLEDCPDDVTKLYREYVAREVHQVGDGIGVWRVRRDGPVRPAALQH